MMDEGMDSIDDYLNSILNEANTKAKENDYKADPFHSTEMRPSVKAKVDGYDEDYEDDILYSTPR
jgi:hypothetical protein